MYTSRRTITYFFVLLMVLFLSPANNQAKNQITLLSPAHLARAINPDTHLVLTFPDTPTLGKSGKIKIFEAKTNRLVDMLDLSIPAGPIRGITGPKAPYTPVPYPYDGLRKTNADTRPGTPSGLAVATSDSFQLTIIGGFTDAFHFYPVIVRGKTATIYPHNNLLEYGKTYYVQLDPTVLTFSGKAFKGVSGKKGWVFSTKTQPPSIHLDSLTVSADGKGDFNTVQGALDFIPDRPTSRKTIFIRNGDYEEIVYFRNKYDITIKGENREKVVVHYANNEVFNPHPSNLSTNEIVGTFPSRRAAFSADHCTGIHLVDMTIQTTAKGQAEGLLLNGEKNLVRRVTVVGSGDALQTNGSAYFADCKLIGDGDMILGRGPAFFRNCELYSYGPFMWIRNTEANHGNVFQHCRFQTLGKGETELARAPTNGGKDYPHCEAVLLNCTLSGISPIGWGPIGRDTSNVHFWEFNSLNRKDGKPVDVSQRHPASKQLTLPTDSVLIQQYGQPAFVLGGWNPETELSE